MKAVPKDVREKIRRAFLDGWIASFKGAELSSVLIAQAELEANKYSKDRAHR